MESSTGLCWVPPGVADTKTPIFWQGEQSRYGEIASRIARTECVFDSHAIQMERHLGDELSEHGLTLLNRAIEKNLPQIGDIGGNIFVTQRPRSRMRLLSAQTRQLGS